MLYVKLLIIINYFKLSKVNVVGYLMLGILNNEFVNFYWNKNQLKQKKRKILEKVIREKGKRAGLQITLNNT